MIEQVPLLAFVFLPILLPLLVLFTFPVVLNLVNVTLLRSKLNRFTVTALSTILVLLCWYVLTGDQLTESYITSIFTETSGVQSNSQFSQTIETLHTTSNHMSIFLSALFGIFYFIVVYFSWLVLSLILRPFRGKKPQTTG